MTTTPDQPATTWRDVADQLTPEQIAHFERQEATFNQLLQARQSQPLPTAWASESAESITRGILADARREAQQNLNDQLFDVPLPQGADVATVDHWEDDWAGNWTRTLHGKSRVIDGIDAAVYLTGTQSMDGTVVWSLLVHVEDRGELNSSQVRKLAAALLDAADELDSIK